MTLSAYNPFTRQFAEDLTGTNPNTPKMNNADLQQWMSDNRNLALPSALGQLFGGGSLAGTATPVALGNGFSLTLVNGILTLTYAGSGGTSSITGITIDGSTIAASTSSPYQMATADRAVVVNKTTGAATKLLLPTTPQLWVAYKIKDGKGDAATNNITVAFAGSGTIDGETTFLMNAPSDGFSFYASSPTTWWVE
jgi:hypothetical protein